CFVNLWIAGETAGPDGALGGFRAAGAPLSTIGDVDSGTGPMVTCVREGMMPTCSVCHKTNQFLRIEAFGVCSDCYPEHGP
ncbi:hypothetical protein ABTF68_22560, partial [Acinetobacter baumannii]